MTELNKYFTTKNTFLVSISRTAFRLILINKYFIQVSFSSLPDLRKRFEIYKILYIRKTYKLHDN